MEEVIMKKLLFWMVLIVGIVVLIGSCKKDEESSTAAAAKCAGMTVAEVTTCTDTPSGSITGIDNSTMSGVYDPYHVYGISGTAGVDNTTGCISNASLLAILGGPTGTASVITNTAVTSSSSMAARHKYYSDSSCSTELASISFGYTDVTLGENVTGLSTTVTGKSGTYPSTATQVTYKNSCFIAKGSTAAGVTYLETLFGGALDLVVGTEYKCQNSGSTKYNLMKVWDTSALSSGTDSIWYFDDSSTAYPTDWTDDTSTFTQLP
jgi:hypothetical protein